MVTIRRQPSFDAAFRKLLKRRIARFRINAQRVAGSKRGADLHAVRIKGKQLRYLIEPFAAESARLRRTKKALETLQSSLGDLHDIEVLRSRCSEISCKAGNLQQFRQLGKILKDEEMALGSKALDRLSRKRLSRTLKETISSLKRPILSRRFHLRRLATKGGPPVGAR
jgi:CHAD domain-containing protein